MVGLLNQSLPKAYTCGAHRSVTPNETLARIRPLAASMGITRLGNVTGLDSIGIPVAIAVRPRSRSVAVSQGKGATLAHAMASALMEAAELAHGENLGGRVRWASLRSLDIGARAAPLALLPGTDRPLDANTELPWVEGFDLVDGRSCWLPADLIHTEFKSGETKFGDYFPASSNGLASGNHLLEAICSGLCEVVERDAVAIWEHQRIEMRARCRVDVATVDDPACMALLEKFERAQMAVQLWDVTSDCEVPVFVSEIQPRIHDPSAMSRRARGAGCHVSRGIALSRALTEAAQVRLTHITGVRDDIHFEAYRNELAARTGAALLDALAAALPSRSFCAVPTFVSDDIGEDVRWLLHRLRSAGLHSVLIVDLTRTEFGIPVVRVVVPGLEGYSAHPEYRPGPRARRAGAAGS